MRERRAVEYPDDPPWPELIAAHVAGDRAGGDALARGLDAVVRVTVANMLGEEDRDADDLVSETVVAVLEHLRREGGFRGRLPVFAISVARNRCRNLLAWRRRRAVAPLESLLDWYREPTRSPLDLLEEREVEQLVGDALASLDPECARLLRASYLEDVPVSILRERLGLTTVQGVYYRRARCLEKAFRYLNKRLLGCSQRADTDAADDSPWGGEPRA